MKTLLKTTDRKQVNAQLRAFTKSANAGLDLRKETREINWLTRVLPRLSLQYKCTLAGRHCFFSVALLVVTEYQTAAVCGAHNFACWFERRELHDRKMSFCVVSYNDKGEYNLLDCTDMNAAAATVFFKEIDKKRIH